MDGMDGFTYFPFVATLTKYGDIVSGCNVCVYYHDIVLFFIWLIY